MNIGQGTILQEEEYKFMLKFLSGENPRLPRVLIDYYACKPLRLSLQNARVKMKDKAVLKDKSSERLPAEELPTRSTNPSDAFKYFSMSREFRELVRVKASTLAGNLDPIIK